jgi:hypothetical protein
MIPINQVLNTLIQQVNPDEVIEDVDSDDNEEMNTGDDEVIDNKMNSEDDSLVDEDEKYNEFLNKYLDSM